MRSKFSYKGDTLGTGILIWLWEGLRDSGKQRNYSDYKTTNNVPYKKYYDQIYKLNRTGYVKVISKDGKKFLELTTKGQIESLLIASLHEKPLKWDGKWRMVIFDIPEEARNRRNQLRSLLTENGFRRLQDSVFVSPHPLNRYAIEYLKESKLISYIRILKVEEMDDDSDLQKLFKLNSNKT
jgi:CRISPR-associated endonuclease Cas2